MSFALVVMRRVVRRLLTIQFIIMLVVAAIYLILESFNGFLAALYGGSITILSTLLISWRISRAGEVASNEQQQAYLEVYIGAIQKFVLTLILMAIGMGYLKLNALAILICFAATQLSFVFNKVDTRF